MRRANAASARFAMLRAQSRPILGAREAKQEVDMALQSLHLVQLLPPAIPDVPGFAYYTAPQWRPRPAPARPTGGPSRDALEQHFSYFDTQD